MWCCVPTSMRRRQLKLLSAPFVQTLIHELDAMSRQCPRPAQYGFGGDNDWRAGLLIDEEIVARLFALNEGRAAKQWPPPERERLTTKKAARLPGRPFSSPSGGGAGAERRRRGRRTRVEAFFPSPLKGERIRRLGSLLPSRSWRGVLSGSGHPLYLEIGA